MTEASATSWTDWPNEAKIRLWWAAKVRLWRTGTAHGPQRIPDGHRVTYVRGGRGTGKTRASSETLAGWIYDHPGKEWAVVAPTYSDARDVNIEGPSGLLAVLGPTVKVWNRSIGELRLVDGSTIRIDGADDGALRIQGHNLAGAACDEVGLWRRWETAWHESIQFAVRVPPARIIATGTPKAGHKLVKLLLEDDEVCNRLLRREDNTPHLDAATVAGWERRYAGTRLGRQELEGEWLEDVQGAMWSTDLIQAARERYVPRAPDQYRRIVVAVDPSWGTTGDECGIVAAGLIDAQPRPRAAVIRDVSVRATPAEWASAALNLAAELRAEILVETTMQREQVHLAFRAVGENVTIREVDAGGKAKRVRADWVLPLYEQSLVDHAPGLDRLEAELTEWVPAPVTLPDGTHIEASKWSPNRLDATVYALSDLLLNRRGPATMHEPTGRIPVFGGV